MSLRFGMRCKQGGKQIGTISRRHRCLASLVTLLTLAAASWSSAVRSQDLHMMIATTLKEDRSLSRSTSAMAQASSQVSVTSRTIAVEHIRLASSRPFAEVRDKLEGMIPKLDASVVETLSSGDQKRAKDYDENGPKLSIFGERDHGALLQIVGKKRGAIQYEIGNPLTASKMTRHQLAAALYAPLRVVLFEDEEGRAIFEYDKPSSFFGQYGDQQVTEVGRYLDATLEAVLLRATD